MNQAGKLAVKVHSASGFAASPALAGRGVGPGQPVYCVCEVPGYGRLCCEPRPAGAGPAEPTVFEQELTFEMGPSEGPRQLRVALYAVVGDEAGSGGGKEGEGPDDEFIGGGSLSLAHLEEGGTQRHLRIPIVTPEGAHLADVSVHLRFYYARSPARQRDLNGREFIDEELAAAGPTQAAKLVNQRSPRSPTAPGRPGSPRIKPPPQDPPVPELPASLRSPLKGGGD